MEKYSERMLEFFDELFKYFERNKAVLNKEIVEIIKNISNDKDEAVVIALFLGYLSGFLKTKTDGFSFDEELALITFLGSLFMKKRLDEGTVKKIISEVLEMFLEGSKTEKKIELFYFV